MQTEIEKRIEEAAWHFEGDINVGRDCYNCNGYSDGLTEGFKAGAKFILEMPEFGMIKSFLNFASIENASQREVSFHAKELLESLKKAGLCE